MKKLEQNLSRDLRRKGLSMNEIAAKLKVSKSSVSLWVRDIELTSEQNRKLSEKGKTRELVEKRRQTRLIREKSKRDIIVDKAFKEISSISKKELFHIGVSLYWAEGSKSKRGSVEFWNSDPRLIQIMKRFFKEACGIPEKKFHGRVLLHPHLNAKKAERYWSKVSKIPLKQFGKTTQQHNKSSKNKKDSLPNGTFELAIYSTELFLKLKGWRRGVYERLKI